MTSSGFRKLVDQIRALAHAPAAAVEGYADIDIDGIRFILMDGRMVEEGSMLYLSDLGAVPADARATVLQGLVDANLVTLGIGTPCFMVNQEDNHVLMMGRVSIADTSASVLYDAFVQHARHARQWRLPQFVLEHEWDSAGSENI